MYSIIIVDDAQVARTSIWNYINQTHTEFHIDSVFSNGDDAMVYLREHTVQVVITDIVMPGTDGLTLAEYVFKNHPSTIVILISSYSEFEYARKAINYGVYTYLLKPLDYSELSAQLNEIKKRLDTQPSKSMPKNDSPLTNEDILLQKILDYIHSHYAENLTRETVADAAFLSYSYFSRFFKSKMNVSFSDYLTTVRMEKAMELLQTKMKIQDIAKKVGYLSLNRFFINFRNYSGYTPKEYRIQVLKMED